MPHPIEHKNQIIDFIGFWWLPKFSRMDGFTKLRGSHFLKLFCKIWRIPKPS
jgi:hypothetical protein